MIISIDGPAGSGKSTVADILAEKLGFIHFNSGALYRGITSHLLSNEFDFSKIDIETPIFDFNIETKFEKNIQRVFVENIDYTAKLRDNQVSQLTPKVSSNRYIRKIVDDCQRLFCNTHNVVVEGRDIGSFVFPNAEHKFYLDCSVSERARRRFLEEKAKNNNISLQELEKQIIERDEIDKNKKIAPLVVPKNAIIIDSSTLTAEQVADLMHKYIK